MFSEPLTRHPRWCQDDVGIGQPPEAWVVILIHKNSIAFNLFPTLPKIGWNGLLWIAVSNISSMLFPFRNALVISVIGPSAAFGSHSRSCQAWGTSSQLGPELFSSGQWPVASELRCCAEVSRRSGELKSGEHRSCFMILLEHLTVISLVRFHHWWKKILSENIWIRLVWSHDPSWMLCSCAYTWYKIEICLAYICIYFTSEARGDLPPSSRVMAQIPHEVVRSSVFAAKFPPKTEFFPRRSNICPHEKVKNGEEMVEFWSFYHFRWGKSSAYVGFSWIFHCHQGRVLMIGTACQRPDLQNRQVTMPKAGSLGKLPRFTPKRCWNQLKPMSQQKLPIYVVNMTIPSGYD